MLRSPSAVEGSGGATTVDQKKASGSMLMLRDQMATLAVENGLKVPDALLPTPAVAHIRNHDEDIDGYMKRRADFAEGKTNGMPGASLGVAVRLVESGIDDWQNPKLLPTPNTMDSLPPRTPEALAEAKERSAAGFSNLRESVVNDLFPTTNANDWKGPNLANPSSNSGHGMAAVAHGIAPTSWGKFEPAIRRWESATGRTAPAPTIPDGKEGAHRLSSRFAEWMMGLPDGWITDAGVGRVAELKMAGNGVVPQQASLALKRLLGVPVPQETTEVAVLPTPTVQDQRDGKYLRNVAVENLKNGKNRGVGLNHLVENIGVDWEEGDTFDVIDGKAVKVGE